MNELFLFNVPVIHLRFVSVFAIEKIAQILQEKGMNVEAAYERAKALFSHELEKADLYLHNLHKLLQTGEHEDAYAYLANKALFRQNFDFTSYDHMRGLLQQVRTQHLDEEQMQSLRKVLQANRYGVIASV